MARKSIRSATPQPNAVASGLFFGGTEHVREYDQDDNDSREQSYLCESDADEDDDYADSAVGGTRRKAHKSTQKRTRASGGRVGGPKQFESDYDTDDKRIVELKQAGYKDDYISNKLDEEGREHHTAKRVGSRWLRLKKIVERKEEERLDDELSDWHIGEDEKLRDSFNAMEAKYEVELLKLKEKKWKDVSTLLTEALGERKYTPKACKERWESLEDGTALIPIELDGDQGARAVVRAARIAENKRRRDEKKAAAIWALGEKDRKAAAKRAVLEERERERQAERARKQAERDEDDRIKAEQRAGLEAKRAKQRAAEAKVKEEFEAKREERKNADAMYMYYTGKKLNGRRDDNLIKPVEDDDDKSQFTNSDVDMEEFDFDQTDLTDAEESSVEGGADDAETTRGRSSRSDRAVKRARIATKSKKPKVTLDTLINPRSIMNDNELADVLVRRGLARRSREETHAEVVARIAAVDDAAEPKELKRLLESYFERRKGPRELQVRRLQEYDAASSELGMQGVTAMDPEFKRGYEGYVGKFAYALEDLESGEDEAAAAGREGGDA